MTSELQPLDIKIHGILKSHIRRLWRESLLKDPFKEFTLSDCVINLLESCELITKDIIIDSFEPLFH